MRAGANSPTREMMQREQATRRPDLSPRNGRGGGTGRSGLAAADLSGLAGKSVIVTGAGGTIGREICTRLLGCRPARIVMVEQGELALTAIHRSLAAQARQSGVTLVPALGSVADAPFVSDVIVANGANVILHAAAYKHVDVVERNPRAGITNNTLATALLAQKAREHGVERFVLVSTDKAMCAAGVMGASKRFAEWIVLDLASRSGGTAFCVVRFGNVTDSSGSVLPLFREQIATGGPVTLTDPDATRYFMSVEDAGHLVLAACCMAGGGEVFALDMGPPVRIRDLAVGLIRAAGRTVRDAADPLGQIEIVTTGLRPGEKLHETPLARSNRMPTGHPRIFRLPEGSLPEFRVAAMLRDLREAADLGCEDTLRRTVARWIATDRDTGSDDQSRHRPGTSLVAHS